MNWKINQEKLGIKRKKTVVEERVMVKKWEVLDRKTVLEDKWIHIEASKCKLSDGTIIEPFYVNHIPDFAVIVPVTEEGNVVLVRQYRHGVEEVLLELPAGCMEAGEEPEISARRELAEETGCTGGEWEFLFKLSPDASKSSNYAWCFLAKGVRRTQVQHLDETEELEIVEMPVSEVREALDKGQFVQAVHAAALYAFLCREKG